VLELIATDAAIIACHAPGGALDGVGAPAGAVALRIAPDELWLVGPLEARDGLALAARSALGAAAPLVVDQSDGWTVWTVRGDRHSTVLDRLMLAPVPARRPVFVQGAITGVPGKVLAVLGAVHLFVPAPVGHHLRDRILAACADLEPTQSGPVSLSLEPTGR
jgi:sarcosine oxidase gamma subunit